MVIQFWKTFKAAVVVVVVLTCWIIILLFQYNNLI